MIGFKYLIVIFFLLFSTVAFSNVDEINKINQQIESIDGLFKSGAMDEDEYDKIKTRLLIKKKKLENTDNTNNEGEDESSVTLKKQIEVLEKLLKDGAISEEEFLKSKTFLEKKEATGQNIDLNEMAEESKPAIDYVYNYKKDPGRKNWEKVVLEFKNYKILPYRPGGIKIVRASDNKKLFHIVDNFKTKHFLGSEKNITFKKTVYDTTTGLQIGDAVNEMISDIGKSLKDVGRLLKNPFSEKKKPIWNKEAHKLELFIDGSKILTFEGRYVKKHRAFFYQVLTPRNQPFHYYIKIASKKAIALNMEFFNVKIDKAIRKAKKRLSEEYDVTEEEIQKIIDKQISQEMDKTLDKEIEKEMEKAINASVAEAIEQSVGQELSALLVNAIEEATGEAIEQSIEQELAAAIDAEIAYAVSIGIDEAAVTAGWEAYFEVLAAGGTTEEASAAAYEACGSACDNY